MKLSCTINGQPTEIEIDGFVMSPGALKHPAAMRYLGVKRSKFYVLLGMGCFHETSYGTIPVTELDAHLKEEVKVKRATR